MFEIGYSEILVIAIVLIVVVGPKDLPKMLRAFGKAMTKFRQMSGDFQRQFNDALKEAELDEVRKTIADVRKLDPRQQVRDVFNPLRDVGNSLKADLNKVVQAPVAPAMTAPVLPPAAKSVSKAKSAPKSSVKTATAATAETGKAKSKAVASPKTESKSTPVTVAKASKVVAVAAKRAKSTTVKGKSDK